MEALIQGTISALGFLEDGVYYQEPDCFESVRDLIRFLRNDTQDLLARRVCGERNIVENDLIHIMKAEENNDKMFDIVLRLLANLIQPAAVSLMGKPPQDRESFHLLWTLEDNLRRTKTAFTDVEFFKVLKTKLDTYFLHTEWDDRTEDQKLVMERIIVLIRYIFAIPCGKGDDRRTKMETNTHDKVISAFVESNIADVLIHISSQSSERDFHLSILQIFGYVVKEHSAAEIVSTIYGRSTEEKEKAEAEMRMIFENEMNKAALQKRNVMCNRHSRFSGSYVVKGVQAVNRDNDFVVHKAVKDVSKLSFNDERKVKKRIAKNRRPFEVADNTHTSSIEVRLQIKTFVELVLSKSFNVIMKNSKDLAFGTKTALGQKNADVHYFLVMRFFLEYCRLAKMSTSLVSSCLGIEAFHHLQVQLEEALENATAQRKEARYFGMKAQYALSAYKELILIHQHMLDNGQSDDKKFAQNTCAHILKVEEYRDLTAGVMRRFMPGAFSKGFLRELVLSTHHYLRLLEKSVKCGELTTVSRRQKKRKPKKNTESHHDVPKQSTVDFLKGEALDEVWADIADELSACVMGHLEPVMNRSPVNNLLDVSDEEHQRFAMLYIQRALREDSVQEAVGLYRSSREIWYSEGFFGDNSLSPEEEFCEIREIFFGDLSEIASSLLTAETIADERFRGKSGMVNNEEYDSEDEEEDDFETTEVKFDFDEYVGKYARTEILRWYVLLLSEFDKNSFELNKALVKMLHRISFDLKMPSRLYQLSLFRVFMMVNERLNILTVEEKKKSPLYELHTFGYHLLKRFMTTYVELGDKLAPEVLFWKGAKEVYEIENKYETQYEHRDLDKIKWSEELEDEVRALYSEYLDMEERPEDIDVLDFIEHNMSRPRKRRQIQRKLKEFGLDTLGAKASKGSAKERTFPIIDFKQFIDDYNADETLKDEDLVDYLQRCLQQAEKGEYSRQKIIKQLAYVGCPYERKKKASTKKAALPWEDDLESELKNIVDEHKTLAEEETSLINIVDFIMKRLSQKKSRKQIENRLVALNIIEEPEKNPRAPRAPKMKQSKSGKKNKNDDFIANSDSENEEEDDLDDADDDLAEYNNEVSVSMAENDDDEDSSSSSVGKNSFIEEKEAEENNEKISSAAFSDITNEVSQKSKPRAMVVDSDDEQGDMRLVENTISKTQSQQSATSKKRKRVILSDDEDNDNSNSSEDVVLHKQSELMRQSASPDVSPVRPKKKISRIIDSDDED